MPRQTAYVSRVGQSSIESRVGQSHGAPPLVVPLLIMLWIDESSEYRHNPEWWDEDLVLWSAVTARARAQNLFNRPGIVRVNDDATLGEDDKGPILPADVGFPTSDFIRLRQSNRGIPPTEEDPDRTVYFSHRQNLSVIESFSTAGWDRVIFIVDSSGSMTSLELEPGFAETDSQGRWIVNEAGAVVTAFNSERWIRACAAAWVTYNPSDAVM